MTTITRTCSLFGLFLPVLFNYLLPSMTSLMASLEQASYTLEVKNSQEFEKDTFDFIIIGGGSAGSVLTNRLSEHFSVLLLERGGEPNPFTTIPLNTNSLSGHPDVDYGFKTVPQTGACLGNYNKSCSWSSGKGLGGSSNINWQFYFRGHPSDYDVWANITGDERWSYKQVFQFFLKSEQYCVACEKYENDPTFNPLFHNTNGLLGIQKSTSQHLAEEFMEASEWDGVKRTDLNAPYTEGCAPIVYTMKYGRRCSTKIAFIDPIRKRPNLTIRKYARAYKLLFRNGSDSHEAYGVQYEHVGISKVAFASKEIIISAGAIETPKLLMLSGIGPKDELKSLGIPVLLDLPVGKNLQDHLGTFVGPFLIKDGKSLLVERDITFSSFLEYVVKGVGHLTQTGFSISSFWVSSLAKENEEPHWPDVQYLFSGLGLSVLSTTFLNQALNIRSDLTNAFYDSVMGKDALHIVVFNVRPKSRGQVILVSKDYNDDPIMDPKYFMDEKQRDIEVALEGIKRAVHIAENAPSLKDLGSKLSPTPFPSCVNNVAFRSDEYWKCVARHFSFSNFHYSGTAAMGKEGSPQAVVDSELRVIGVKRLRVIDASIFPLIPSVNTNGPTIMVAERGAQFIINAYLQK